MYSNFFRQGKVSTFTSNSLQHGDMVHLGGGQVFERKLIEHYTSQLVSKASSWQKFVDGLNLSAFNSNLTESKAEWRKRFAMAFIKYKTIEFDLSLGSPAVSIPSSVCDFDDWIWKQFPRLLTSFVYLWSNHKTLIGSCTADCSRTVIVDGHQKCRRRICRAKNVQIATEEFRSLTVGCCRTPRMRSYFCELHQDLDDRSDTSAATMKPNINRKDTKIRQFFHRKGRNIGFGATNCRTIKERSEKYVERCNRSFGILAVVTNCKIIVTFSEIFRSETIREIISLFCSTIRGTQHLHSRRRLSLNSREPNCNCATKCAQSVWWIPRLFFTSLGS